MAYDPIDRLREEIDQQVFDIHLASTERRRQLDAQILPPTAPKIESNFSAHPNVPFGKPDRVKKEPFMLRRPFTCPTASLVCDSVSASKSKCGFTEFTSPSTPPKYYLTRTAVLSYSYTVSDSTHSGSGSASATEVTSYDPSDCTSGVTARSGSSSGSRTDTSGFTLSCTGSFISGSVAGATFFTNSHFHDVCVTTGGTITQNDEEGCWDCDPLAACRFTNAPTVAPSTKTYSLNGSTGSGSCTGSVVITLSDEYTTADLKSNVIAALPAFDGPFDDSCSATYNLSSDEHSFTLSRVKYKIQLSAPACAGMVVSWNEHFQPSPSGSPTNTAKTWTATGGETETPAFTIPDPTSNGTTTVTGISVSCEGCTDENKVMMGEVEA